jgi:NhaA family Na+:H+ antiporter
MSADHSKGNRFLYIAQEFSLPLLAGVVVALVIANTTPKLYNKIVNQTYAFFVAEQDHQPGQPSHDHQDHGNEHHDHEKEDPSNVEHAENHGHVSGWRHYCTLHFIINDLFMVLFFGIAAKEIAESCLPGGALNPITKAVNPLMGTIGGVLGPVGVYLLLNAMIGQPEWFWGWGIPTATDIALAWLIARVVFGTGHPAISFLLLLAVADDGIGLLIIAFVYPTNDPAWLNLLWIIPGMAIALGLRIRNIQAWTPYIFIGGAFSWWGLYSAHLHPALALVPIIPFLPGPKRDEGLFRDDITTIETDPLNRFEHDLKLPVDFGLFFFAFANAGVQFESMSNLTWIVLLSLLIGKTVGISLFSWAGSVFGFPLPDGMKIKHLVVAGVIAGLGLTVALFVAHQAFSDADFRGASKMGALFSGGIAILAIILGRMLGVKDGGIQDGGANDQSETQPIQPTK